jgi:hypothetical protein
MSYIVKLEKCEWFDSVHCLLLDYACKNNIYGRVLMRKVWKDRCNVIIHYHAEREEDRLRDDGIWTALEFESKEAYVLFMLEWC